MTPYQSRILAHLIWMDSMEPAYAEKAARNYAKLDQHELENMPELLKQSKAGTHKNLITSNSTELKATP